MSTPTIYSYHPVTHVFVSVEQADPDPLAINGFLMPAHSTLIPIPQNIPIGQVAVFDVQGNAWSVVAAELFQPAPVPQAPPPTLQQVKSLAEASIDAHFERLYYMAVPNAAIANEYASAYEAAKIWLASLGGPVVQIVPKRVTALAQSMSQSMGVTVTERQAAEFVVAKYIEADRVLDERGAARLAAKMNIRAAVDEAAVSTALEAGKVAIEAVAYTI